MKEFIFNNLTHKSPAGTTKARQGVVFSLQVAQIVFSPNVKFVYYKDGSSEKVTQEMHFKGLADGYKLFTATIRFPSAGLFWYYFLVDGRYVQAGKNDGEVKSLLSLSSPFSQVVTENKLIMTEDAPAGGVIYHVFVDRFNKGADKNAREPLFLNPTWGGKPTDSADFAVINSECYGGDLRGIIEKLNYFKTLNVSILYLSPIFYANSNHKYNTADFMQVDPMFGSDDDLKELCAKAGKLGIKIVLDGVFNHVGSDSVYFNRFGRFKAIGAFNSLSSKYADWFNFAEWPNTYDCWWGDPTLPCLNENARSYQNLICGKNGVIEKYMGLGVSGFRLDVVDELSEPFLNKICKKIYSINKDAIIIGEVWEDASKKIAYNERKKYLLGKELNSVTNYPLKNAILNYVTTSGTEDLEDVFNNISDDYPNFVKYRLMNILGSHDTSRVFSVISKNASSKQDALKKLKIASLIEYVFVGLPTIYYGDETLLTDLKENNSRACYPWGKENQTAIDWFISLGKLRKEKALVLGDINLVVPENGVVQITRQFNSRQVILLTNMSDTEYSVSVDGTYTDYFLNKPVTKSVTVAPTSFTVLVKK